MVGREVSAQPPWSMATSTITEPGFIAFTVCAEMSFGAVAPGTRTVAMTRSARRHTVSTTSRVENSVRTRFPNCAARRRNASGLRSSTVTSAPMPEAIKAALLPATPPPRIDHARRRDAGDAGKEHAAAAVFLFRGTERRRGAPCARPLPTSV